MAGYSVETRTHRIGAEDFHIRSLLDRQQYWDPDRCAERAGISSAAWPIFGVLFACDRIDNRLNFSQS